MHGQNDDNGFKTSIERATFLLHCFFKIPYEQNEFYNKFTKMQLTYIEIKWTK